MQRKCRLELGVAGAAQANQPPGVDAEQLATESRGAVVYSRLMEGLLRVIRNHPSAADADRLLTQLGLDEDHVRPTYPVLVWDSTLRRVASVLFPRESPEQSWDELGYAIARAYFETPVGRALGAVARLMGPHRSLARTVASFEAAANYLRTRYAETGSAQGEVTTEVLPEYLAALAGKQVAFTEMRLGALRGALEILGLKDGQVEVARRDLEGQQYLYRLSWVPRVGP